MLPATGIFTALETFVGDVDIRLLATLLVFVGGLGGLVVNGVWRRFKRLSDQPDNRLSLGCALIAIAGFQAYGFPGGYPYGSQYAVPCSGPLFCTLGASPEPIPTAALLLLLAAAVCVVLPLDRSPLVALSVIAGVLAVASALWFWSETGYYSDLIGPLAGILAGGLVSLYGSVPMLWQIHLSPRHAPLWPTA
jgi:hypothetical protein